METRIIYSYHNLNQPNNEMTTNEMTVEKEVLIEEPVFTPSKYTLKQLEKQANRINEMLCFLKKTKQVEFYGSMEISFNPFIKSVACPEKKLMEYVTDKPCSICLETHLFGNCVTLQCGHMFGSKCIKSWLDKPTSNDQCPNCRSEITEIKMYRKRKT